MSYALLFGRHVDKAMLVGHWYSLDPFIFLEMIYDCIDSWGNMSYIILGKMSESEALNRGQLIEVNHFCCCMQPATFRLIL